LPWRPGSKDIPRRRQSRSDMLLCRSRRRMRSGRKSAHAGGYAAAARLRSCGWTGHDPIVPPRSRIRSRTLQDAVEADSVRCRSIRVRSLPHFTPWTKRPARSSSPGSAEQANHRTRLLHRAAGRASQYRRHSSPYCECGAFSLRNVFDTDGDNDRSIPTDLRHCLWRT